MRKSDLLNCQKTFDGFLKLFRTYIKIGGTYIVKIQPHCLVKDGLWGYGGDELEYPLRTFEVIGVLGSLAMAYHCYGSFIQDDEKKREYFENTKAIAKTLADLIENNPAAHSPRYDGHSIDIILGLLTLQSVGYSNIAADWVIRISKAIICGYQLGKYFPIASDSYEQLVALEFGQALPKEKLMELSTILPMLADWYVILDLSAEYSAFQQAVIRVLASTNLQYWYPDATTDDCLYACNAGYRSGITASSIKLPENTEKHKLLVTGLLESHQKFKQFSCFKHGFPVLALISSRHFRTPVIPAFWQYDVLVPKSSDTE